MDYIRERMYSTFFGENYDSSIQIKLYLEKAQHQESKTKEFVQNIWQYESDENYAIFLNKKAQFGVRHVNIVNGDVFIGEIQSDVTEGYINAKDYVTDLYDNITVPIIYYDRMQSTGYESFSKKLHEDFQLDSSFTLPLKISHRQKDIMEKIYDVYSACPVNLS